MVTRRQRVQEALTQALREGRVEVEGRSRACPDGWVPGYVLASREIGGSEGLRRLRELRDLGVEIARRKASDDRTSYEYRLIDLPRAELRPFPEFEDW